MAISFLHLPWQRVLVSDFEGGWLHFMDGHGCLLMCILGSHCTVLDIYHVIGKLGGSLDLILLEIKTMFSTWSHLTSLLRREPISKTVFCVWR